MSSFAKLFRFYTILVSEIGIALVSNCIIISLNAKTVSVPKWIRAIFLRNNLKIFLLALQTKFFSKLTHEPKTANTIRKSFTPNVSQKSWKNTDAANETHPRGHQFDRAIEPKQFCDFRNKLEKIAVTESSVLKFEKVDNQYLEYLKSINEYLASDLKEHEVQKEWQEVVKSIDRIFFTLFMLIIMASVIFIFSTAPNVNF